MHKCVSAMHKYTSHTHTLTVQWYTSLAWYLKLPFILEHSSDSARIICQRESTREWGEPCIRSCFLPPQVYFESSSHSISTSLFMDLIIWSQCTSVNKKFGWVTSKIKSRKNLSKREKMGEVVLQNFRAGSDLTNIHMLVVLPWAN